MNDTINVPYRLTVDCDQCPGPSCKLCDGEGVVDVCPRCEELECLCSDGEDGEQEPDDAWNLGLTSIRPW